MIGADSAAPGSSCIKSEGWDRLQKLGGHAVLGAHGTNTVSGLVGRGPLWKPGRIGWRVSQRTGVRVRDLSQH